MPHDDEASSLNGLGGYHGSVHVGGDAGATIYYAVGVYSEALPDGSQNGIPVFNENWKNVVATFYHELNEARTDPDVEDADPHRRHQRSRMDVRHWRGVRRFSRG